MMKKTMPADDAANDKASTGQSDTTSDTPSEAGSLVCCEIHEKQDVQVAAIPSLEAGDEVHFSQSAKQEEALPGVAVDDDDDAEDMSKLEEVDRPKAKPVLLGMHNINSAVEVQGPIMSEMHDLNCAEEAQGSILPEMRDINSADIRGPIPPEMRDLNSPNKVEDIFLPEMHDINSAHKLGDPIILGMHGINSVGKVEGPILPEMHDVNSTPEVQGSILLEMHDISFAEEVKGPILHNMHDINSADKVEDPIVPEMHDLSSAEDVQGRLKQNLVDYGKIVKQKESSCLSEVQEKVETMSAIDGYVDITNANIEAGIEEVLSSKDGNIPSNNSQSDHGDDKATCFDGEKLSCSNLQSSGDIENGCDFGHVEFGDEDAAAVLEGSRNSVRLRARHEPENWAVRDDVNIDSEMIIHVPSTDDLPTSEKVGIEFSDSNLSCADRVEAHAGFTKTCSSDNVKFTEDSPDFSSEVANESSKLEGDVSTTSDFLPITECCRTDASATAAEMCEVKLDNSQGFLSEGSDLHMNSDCSLDGTTETKSYLALNNMDHPSSVDTHNSISEEIASSVQSSTDVRKKRIDLGHQLMREIVKIQHDRDQYERQCQQASKKETRNRWKLEKVDTVGKKDETDPEKGTGREVLSQEIAKNGMNGSFHQATNEEEYMSMEKSVTVMRRGDMSREASQSGSKASKYFDKAESVDGNDRRVRKDLLNDEDMRIKDRQLSNKIHTSAEVQREVVLNGGTRYDNFTPAHTGKDSNYQQHTKGARRDAFSYNAQRNKFGSAKEAARGHLLNAERVQPRIVGDAMNQGHLYSVTREISHSEASNLALQGELQFFESRDQVVRKDDIALKASPRHSSKFQNKDQTPRSREEKMGRFRNDNQLRFGPVYRPPSARTSSLSSAQTPSPQRARTPSPPTAQNETTYYFDELDAAVGSQHSFGPSASTSRTSLSTATPFQKRGMVERRNTSLVAGSAWKDASFQDAESQSARVSSEKSTIHETRTSNIAHSTSPRSVNPHLEEEVFGMPVPKWNSDAGRQNRYIDSPMTNAIKIEAEDAEKFVVNFDTKIQKRRIGYLNLNRKDGAQKSLSNISSAPSGNGPSEQQQDPFKELGYHHSGKQTGVKNLAGRVQNMVLVASGSSTQPYQSQAAFGDEHPSNTTQKARFLGGSVKSKDRRHLSNNFREDTYGSPKGAPFFDAQNSVYSDIPHSSAVKPSLELSISGSRNKDNATRKIEIDSNHEVNGAVTHDEFEESWSSPTFPINSLPKVRSTEGVSSKSWKWGDVIDEDDESDEMEFSPLEIKAENNWETKGKAEYAGRVDTTTSSLPNAAQQQKFFVEHSQHIVSKTIAKDAPDNTPAVSGQTSARRSVWERLGPREAATDKLDKTKPAGDGLVIKPPYRSSNLDRSYTGNTSRSRQVDYDQETHFSEFNSLPINSGEAEAVQTYKDEKHKRGKRELYVPRRSSHNF